MALKKVDTDLDFSGVGKIVRALLNPVASDPGTPAIGEVWFNTADSRLKVRINGSTTASLASMADVTGGAITGTLWDAQSVIVAVTDNTPVVQVLPASSVLGRRATGDITAVSYANLWTDLSALAAFNTAVDARVTAGITTLVGSAPAALDTLGELSDALADDANFAATMTTALGLRMRRFAANYGNGTLTSFTVNHNLGTTDVIVSCHVVAGGAEVEAQVVKTDANNVTVSVNTVYAASALRIVVMG
jgi:hypothetical protein